MSHLRREAWLTVAMLVLISSSVWSAAMVQVPAGYAVHTALPLTPNAGQRARRLEVLEDARLLPGIRKEVWGGGDPETGYCYAPTATMQAFCHSVKLNPLKHITLRIVAANGAALDARTFERELALYCRARRSSPALSSGVAKSEYS